MTRVLPLPAPARTSTGPFVVVTASRCGGLSGARIASAVTAERSMGSYDTTAEGPSQETPPSPLSSPPTGERKNRNPSPRRGEGRVRGPEVRGPEVRGGYSTVTDLARLRGWSTSRPRRTAT